MPEVVIDGRVCGRICERCRRGELCLGDWYGNASTIKYRCTYERRTW